LHTQAPLPGAHDRLVRDLAALGMSTSHKPARLPATMPLGAVTIGDVCNVCGLCVKYCPHGSIHLESGRLEVDNLRCTACRLCAEVCPPEAISVRPATLPVTV
jgi:ferredoxin